MLRAHKEVFSHVWNGVVFQDCTIPVFMLLCDTAEGSGESVLSQMLGQTQ